MRSGKEELLRGEVEVFKSVHLRHEQGSWIFLEYVCRCHYGNVRLNLFNSLIFNAPNKGILASPKSKGLCVAECILCRNVWFTDQNRPATELFILSRVYASQPLSTLHPPIQVTPSGDRKHFVFNDRVDQSRSLFVQNKHKTLTQKYQGPRLLKELEAKTRTYLPWKTYGCVPCASAVPTQSRTLQLSTRCWRGRPHWATAFIWKRKE